MMSIMVERSDRKRLGAQTLVGIGDRSVMSVARDISRTGVFIETPQWVQVGQSVKLFIEDHVRRTVIWVTGEVVRVQAGIGFGARFSISEPALQDDFCRMVDALVPSN
jgi:hypothetical protein